jgi:hypothetical protein
MVRAYVLFPLCGSSSSILVGVKSPQYLDVLLHTIAISGLSRLSLARRLFLAGVRIADSLAVLNQEIAFAGRAGSAGHGKGLIQRSEHEINAAVGTGHPVIVENKLGFSQGHKRISI